MTTVADSTNQDQILKQIFAMGVPKDVTQKAGPFYNNLRLVPAGGDSLKIPLRYGYPQGISASFSTALTNARPSTYGSFVLPVTNPWVPLYLVGYVDNQLLYQSRGGPNEYAFAEALMQELNGARSQHFIDMSIYLWGDGSGALGEVKSIPSSTTVTLTLFTDGVKFFAGGKYSSATSKFSTMPTNGVELAADPDIDVKKGTATLTFTTANPSGIAVGDFLFRDGIYATDIGTNVITGVGAWIPPTSPTSTLFFGQNRALSPIRLGGNRVSGATSSVAESITNLAYAMKLLGAQTPTGVSIYLNPVQMQRLQNQSSSSLVRIYEDQQTTSRIGFQAWRANFTSGFSAPIIEDPMIDGDKIYFLDMSSWQLRYTAICDSNAAYWANGIGLGSGVAGVPIILNPSLDNWQFRVYTFSQLVNDAPGYNGVITDCPLTVG